MLAKVNMTKDRQMLVEYAGILKKKYCGIGDMDKEKILTNISVWPAHETLVHVYTLITLLDCVVGSFWQGEHRIQTMGTQNPYVMPSMFWTMIIKIPIVSLKVICPPVTTYQWY